MSSKKENPAKFDLNSFHCQDLRIQEDDRDAQDYPSSSSSSEYYTVGFVIVNIVGHEYYPSTIRCGEMVGLVREQLNFIKVVNTRNFPGGYIEAYPAMVLSPLIDANLITVEGIVSPGERIFFRVPCRIHIFARIDAIPIVRSAILGLGLHLIADPDPSFAFSESAKKEIPNVDEIFKLVSDGNKKGRRELLEPPKNVIKTELFLHQKEGLGWLVQRENSLELPPFWKQTHGLYVNVLTFYQTMKRPEPLRGGIFADDMGLGKTLTLLSLIATNKPVSTHPSSLDTSSRNTDNLKEGEGEEEKEEEGLSFSVGKRSKTGKSGKIYSGLLKKRKLDGSHLDNKGRGEVVLGPKTTLIVCPPSEISTWVTQLGEHTTSGSIKVYMFYGQRTDEVEELQKFDIVLTTYSTLAASPAAMKMEWWRVILDEVHLIKNPKALQSQAVINLKAKRRWVVTGTPIQNGSFDLYALMAFLRFEPFSIQNYWKGLVQLPINQGKERGLSRLQILMATISLRRTKDKGLIELPLKTFETCFVELSPEERKQYDRMEADTQHVVQNYIHAGSLMDVSKNPGLLKTLVSVLQDGYNFDCPICIHTATDITITCCAHIFCRACILRTLKCSKARCPLCRHSLSEADLFSPPPEPFDRDNPGISPGKGTSSKVSALLKLLVASRAENPSTKSLVFSQFRKMLILLEDPLKAAGFSILRFDGTMSAKTRAQVIKKFGDRSEGAPTVLLASLKASDAGINLTAASRVYLLEPWWNLALEEQAMDRVHQVGQKEGVKIVRLIIRNSIEERILQLQERKKKLSREASMRKDVKDQRQIGMEDLCSLIAL